MAEAFEPDTHEPVENDKNLGLYRVCLNTIVRKTEELDSERLKILPMGKRVNVVQKKDRRVRIDYPVEGWCSLVSTNGATILTKIDASELNVKTPQARDPNRPEHLKTQMQTLADNLTQQRTEKNAILRDHPELKSIYDDMQNLKQQIDRAQSEHSRLEAEKMKKTENKRNMEELHLKIEEAKLKIANFESSIQDAQKRLADEAKGLKVKNPYELELQISNLEVTRESLQNQIKTSDNLLEKLASEKDAILSMMTDFGVSSKLSPEKSDLPDVRVEDVMKCGRYGMGTVEYVSDEVVGVKFEAPLAWPDENWPSGWPDPSDGVINGEPLIPHCEPQQTIFFPREHEQCKSKLVSGAVLLEKLNLVMSQLNQNVAARE